jgi:hypothetical protein
MSQPTTEEGTMSSSAFRRSAPVPSNVSTRIVRRGHRFLRRAVYRDGRFVGYTTSHLGCHEAFDKSGEQLHTPDGEQAFPYLNDAIVAVAAAPAHCKGWNTECGTELKGSSELCPDCTMARLDEQSSRIPR